MSSSSNTGVRFLDDAVDSAVNAGAAAGKNIERQLQNVLQGSVMAISGKWDNIGRTLLDVAIIGSGVGLAVNPDDVDRATGSVTAMERMKRTETEKAIQDAEITAASTAAATTAEALRQQQSTITGVVGAQGMAPGKASVLRARSGVGNSLLTFI